MRKLRIAVAGAGNVARTAHLPAIAADPRTELCGVCDASAERARSLAADWGGVPSAASAADLIAAVRPDALCVCVPNAMHRDVASIALDAGVHVFCEKPPATSREEARHLESRAAASGAVLAYNLQYRASAEARFLAEGGCSLGTVYAADARYLRRRGIPGWGSFTRKAVQGGGALIDIGVHCLDLAWYLMGRPKPETCLAASYDFIGKRGGTGSLGAWNGEDFEVEDACFGFIRFSGGASLTIQAATALNTQADKHFQVQLFGDRAGASLFPLRVAAEENGSPVDKSYAWPAADPAALVRGSFSAFADACFGEGRPLCGAEDGTILQGMLEDLYRSAASGAAVDCGREG